MPLADPPKRIKDQYQLAQLPNFMEATLESIRSAVGLAGQREAFGLQDFGAYPLAGASLGKLPP